MPIKTHWLAGSTAVRVTWAEMREGELFLAFADLTPHGWSFFERSTWEARYYPRAPTEELEKKADYLLRTHENGRPVQAAR